jgi:phage shock protein C
MNAPQNPLNPKKLYRSRTERKLAGVCGGFGEYFGVDPVLIRLLWIFFTLAGGGGLLAYIIAWLVVPEPPQGA